MSPEIPSQDQQTPAPSEPTEQEILRLISKPIQDVLDRHVEKESDYEHQWQLLRLEKCDKYIRGLQFLQLDDSAGYYGWQSVSGPQNDYADNGNDGLLDYNLDIVDSYRKKYIATLGLRPFWNAAAVPDDPQSEVDRKAARNANLCAVWMRNKWKVRVQNINIFDRQYSAGTVYIHQPFIADKQIFGEVEETIYQTKIELQDAPPDPITGLPQPPTEMEVVEPAGTKKYPATGPGFFVYDGTMVTIPHNCRDFAKRAWHLLEKEEDRGSLLQMYGKQLRAHLNESGEIVGEESSSGQEEGKRVRGGVESITGTYRPGSESTWTHSRYWLSTGTYEYVNSEDIRKLLYEKFPKGLHIAKIEGVTVRIEDSDMNAEWGCITPVPGATVYQDPICWPILGNQDIVNFIMNIAVAREERGLPTAICDAELIDVEEISKRRFLPNELVPAKAAFGGSLREAVIPLPTPNKDDGAGAYLTNAVIANTESHLGLLKPTWGGQSEQKTASGQRMEIQQGLMQLGVHGEMVSQGWADAYMRGCKLIEENAPKGFVIADEGGSTSEMLDLDAMRAGKYHFEVDAGMPMTRAEMVEVLNGIVQENPEFAMTAGLTAPLAAPIIRDLLIPGMPQIPSPLADVRDKVIKRIQVLLQQSPVPGQPDPMTGEPGPMQPSVMPEEYVDNYAQHAEMTREWLNTSAGTKINPFLGADPKHMPGYQNVVAYGLFCEMKSQPPPPPPQPPKVSVSVNASELMVPGVAEAVNATAGTALPPAPPQQMMPGAPPMDGMPPTGQQQPMAPAGPAQPAGMPANGPMPTIQ